MSLSEGGAMNEGAIFYYAGHTGHTREEKKKQGLNEISVLQNWLMCRFIYSSVTTKRGVEIIRNAKKRGYPCQAETLPHYWMLTDRNIESYNPNMKMNPPLRGRSRMFNSL
jgi:dihydroorotase